MSKKIKVTLIIASCILAVVICAILYLKVTDSRPTYNTVGDTTSNDVEIEHSYEFLKQEHLMNSYIDTLIATDKYTATDPKIIKDPFGTNSLSAYIAFKSDELVTYSYTVKGKDTASDFSFEASDEGYNNIIIVPVVSLYADVNEVELTLTNRLGFESSYTYEIDLTEVKDKITSEDKEALLTTDVISKEDEADKLLANSIILNNRYRGYDVNGDLRYYSELVTTTPDQSTKFTNNSFYFAGQTGEYLYKTDFMGRIKTEYLLPENYINHHDYAVDDRGNVYFLGSSRNKDSSDVNEQQIEANLLKYDDETGEFIENHSLYPDFNQNKVVASGRNGDPIHVNSIEYNTDDNTLIMSSQAQSMVFAVDADSFEVAWILDDPSDVRQHQELVLNVVGDEFIRSSGQHTAHINTNPRYDSYREDSKLVISIYNNNVCKNKNGNEYKAEQTDPLDIDGLNNGTDICPYFLSANQAVPGFPTSQIVVYALDLDDNSVEMIESVDLNRKSPIVSNVYNLNADDSYTEVFSGVSKPSTYYLFDEDYNIILEMQYHHADAGFGSYYRSTAINTEQISSSFTGY